MAKFDPNTSLLGQLNDFFSFLNNSSKTSNASTYGPYLLHLKVTAACLLISFVVNSKTIPLLSSHGELVISIFSVLSLVFLCRTLYTRLRPPPVYLVDFCCTKGSDESLQPVESISYIMRTWDSIKENNLRFQFKVLVKSGIGEESHGPRRLLEKGEAVNMEDARAETEELISMAARSVLQKNGVDPKEIDIVILNSSLFNPAPSLTAFLVNNLKLRSNVKSFNLAGMGCSAGLVSLDLAKDLLKVHRNAYALVVSTENITSNLYFGNDRSMMVSNSLFRCGCAAILLSNKPESQSVAKLQLLHCLRTNLGADKKAFECVHHMEDDEGRLGVSIQMSLIEVAGVALRANITKLAPSILPISELLKVGISMVKKQVLKLQVKLYEPNFKKAIDHFCIHPGGKSVINSIGKGLKLSEYDIEPGKMALSRFGNTSSSGIWYAMCYLEAKGRLRRGNKVWQIGLGSGFKCNSAVWKVLRDIDPMDGLGCNPWLSCIHRYPAPSYVQEHVDRVGKESGLFVPPPSATSLSCNSAPSDPNSDAKPEESKPKA